MKRTLFILIILKISFLLEAQVISADPVMPVDDQPVTITFNAAEGSAGLEGYTGDIYAHTGVITSESTGSSDWRYVKAEWGENITACKLTSIGNDMYTLDIQPSIREFYGVPDGEKIEQLAFVFRSADGSQTGKTSSGGDIFQTITTADLTVTFNLPKELAVYQTGSEVQVSIIATNASEISVYLDEAEVATGSGNSLQASFFAGNVGKYTLKAIASDGSNSVEQSIDFYVRSEVVEEMMPAGLKRGVNIRDDQSVTMVLFAPYKEFVYVIGEFNNWLPDDNYLMKKDGDYFWLTIDGLDKDTEYAFQFFIDGEIRIADPYTNKTLDPDDQYISNNVYPDLKDYPSGLTEHVASLFKINKEIYNWNITEFSNPEVNKLIIYELHIRDFTANGDIKTVKDSIAYLKRLGVTAIELMPFNEFEGNDSWGYNPSFYFAPDKAYGTENNYKEFIDVCHQNGIAVIMDMVLNHSFGQSPFARMYLDGGKPAENNPWYNRDSNIENSGLSWGYDFNHESEHTKELVDSICSFWINEFKVDGYRFDFTKGFSNTPFTVASDEWANGPDPARVAILKRMADEIWNRKQDAIIAFEHLADNVEEKELANYGILLWGNHNHNFNEATMGYNESGKSDFSWASYKNREWNNPHIINYMESHDEERIMFKNLTYGASTAGYDITKLKTALKRTEAAAVFLMSIPGPKMVWQFGELGYDYSINTCTDGTIDDACRTGRKPIVWEYQEEVNRLSLFDTYKTIIDLKKEEPVFSTEDFDMNVWSGVKNISLNYEGSDVRLVGNFNLTSQSVVPGFSSTGYWYNHFKGDSVNVTDLNMQYSLEAGEFALLTQRKLKGFMPHTGLGDPLYFKDASISPNPATSELFIQTGDKPFMGFYVMGVTGEVISTTWETSYSSTIQIEHLSPGVYFLVLKGENNVQRVFKFIKR